MGSCGECVPDGWHVVNPRRMAELKAAERELRVRSAPETVADMLDRVPAGVPLDRLVAVADHYVAKWTALAAEQSATGKLDGRASIYTGETYAQARDRWIEYRAALVGDDAGPCCRGQLSHEPDCLAR